MLDPVELTKELKDYLQSTGHWYARRLFNLYNNYDQLRHDNRLNDTFDAILRNFKALPRVAVVGTIDPIPLVCMIKNHYDSRVTLIGSHALMDLAHGFYEEKLVERCIVKDPFFEEIDYTEYDLVVVPDFEFFVPLRMLKKSNLKSAVFLCVHYVQLVVKHNTALNIYSLQDLVDACGYERLIDSGSSVNVDGRSVHWCLGVT